MTPIIREVAPGSPSMDALVKLRSAVFEDELAHDYAALGDRLDVYSTNLVVELDGEVIAGVRFTVRADGALEDEMALRLDVWGQVFADYEIAQCSRLVVAPGYRGGDLVVRLVARLYVLAEARGVAVVFLDCVPSLVEYYRRFGFAMFCPGYIHSVLGVEYVPLVSVLDRDRVCLDEQMRLDLGTPSYDGVLTGENELRMTETVLASRSASVMYDV